MTSRSDSPLLDLLATSDIERVDEAMEAFIDLELALTPPAT
jgi:hypothetical protein